MIGEQHRPHLLLCLSLGLIQLASCSDRHPTPDAVRLTDLARDAHVEGSPETEALPESDHPRFSWLARTKLPGEPAWHRFVRTQGTLVDSLVIEAPGSIEVETRVPAHRPLLEVDVAAFFHGGQPIDISIAVHSDGQEATKELTLDDSSFQRVRIDLDPLAGNNATITFRAQMAGKSPLKYAPLVVFGAPRLEGEPSKSISDVIIISLDTVRADRLSLYGHGRNTSPTLTALGEESVVFENAVAPSAWTLPSHTTLLSGVLPDRHQTTGKQSQIPTDLLWLPEALQDAGYRTEAFTAGGYVDPAFGFARGFDRYRVVDPAGPPRDWAEQSPAGSREALVRGAELSEASRAELLTALSAPRRSPSFFFIHTYAAHEYRAPENVMEEFGIEATSLPALFASVDTSSADFKLEDLSEEQQKHLTDGTRDLYDASLRVADRLVADVLDALKKSGRLDQTILIITSDHGEELFDHGGFGHEKTLYEELIRIPLIIRASNLKAGRVQDVVSLADLAPTIRDMTELPAADEDGRSLLPLLQGTPLEPKAALSSTRQQNHELHAMRGARYKLLDRISKNGDLERILIDLSADPAEGTDLKSPQETLFLRLQEHLDVMREGLRNRSGKEGTAELSEELERQLKELGYVGDDQ